MSGAREPLAVGWCPGPCASAALCAVVILAAAVAIHAFGLGAGLTILVASGVTAFALWQDAGLDGPVLELRGGTTLGRRSAAQARTIARLEYRRGALLPRLSMHRSADGLVLRATGPRADADAFRRLTTWLIVHGRRRVRIDPALLDALAGVRDHAPADQPHDASHA